MQNTFLKVLSTVTFVFVSFGAAAAEQDVAQPYSEIRPIVSALASLRMNLRVPIPLSTMSDDSGYEVLRVTGELLTCQQIVRVCVEMNAAVQENLRRNGQGYTLWQVQQAGIAACIMGNGCRLVNGEWVVDPFSEVNH